MNCFFCHHPLTDKEQRYCTEDICAKYLVTHYYEKFNQTEKLSLVELSVWHNTNFYLVQYRLGSIYPIKTCNIHDNDYKVLFQRVYPPFTLTPNNVASKLPIYLTFL
jgi:hypothetical protein